MNKILYFIFASPSYHSGQATASRLLVNGFLSRKCLVRSLELPALETNKTFNSSILRILFKVSYYFVSFLMLRDNHNSIYHFNLGQTLFSFFREGFILLFKSIKSGNNNIIIGLHGSSFMNWSPNSIKVAIFKYIILHSSMVCVLGNSQKHKLIKFGIPQHMILVIPNTCVIEPKSFNNKIAFHDKYEVEDTFNILFLSNLIPSKGFPNFLDALILVSERTSSKIDAVLCGRLVDSKLCDQFNTTSQAEEWIQSRLATINNSKTIRIRWIKGADGDFKRELFHQSHLFVFPSTYFNEAQPIVLIEALASGCAIITTSVGEITSTLSEEEATILQDSSPETLAIHIQKIMDDKQLRLKQVKAGDLLFNEHYSMEKHLNNWEQLFINIYNHLNKNY